MVGYHFYKMKNKLSHETLSSAFQGLIGVSKIDITPEIGIYTRNWGAGNSQFSTGVHRPLELTCLTIQESNESSMNIMLSADLGWWKTPDEEETLRKGILEHFGLEEESLLICLTHTHSGPSLSLADSSKKGGHLIKPYLDFLLKSCIQAIDQASLNRFDGTIDWRYGSCELATNRDYYDEANNRYLVGYNPSLKGDKTLLVGRVCDSDEKLKLVVVNYACHPTTLAWDNHLISPDFVGALREVVHEQVGGELLFLQGASGDLAPIMQYVGDPNIADKYGQQLGYSVLSILQQFCEPDTKLTYQGAVESGASLAIWSLTKSTPSLTLAPQKIEIELPLKDLPSVIELKYLWEITEDSVEKERLWRKMGLRKILGDGDTFRLPVWVWKIGNAFVIGQCTEAYSFLQEQLREAFFPIPIVVVNIVNGYIGYLPTADLYGSDAYSVWQSPFEKGSLEKLAQELNQVINKLNQ